MPRKKLTKSKKKNLLIIIAVVLGVLAVAVILFFFTPLGSILQNSSPAEKEANVFLKHLQNNDSARAYSSASTAFKEQASEEDFVIFLEHFPVLSTFESFEVTASTIQDSLAIVSGTIQVREEINPITLTLVQEQGSWHVLNISLNPEDVISEAE